MPLSEHPAHAVAFARVRCVSGACFGLRVLGREPVAFELGKGAKGEVHVRYDLSVQKRETGAVGIIFTESIVSGAMSIVRHGSVELNAPTGVPLKFEFFCTLDGTRLQFDAIA